MRPVLGNVILAWLLLPTWCATAGADGGLMCLSGKKGGYQITVFTSPTPFRAGPVDVSVLVQDAATGDPMTQVQVKVSMTKSGRPALEYPATSEAATNKLLHAAQFELPEPGAWSLEVQVQGSPRLAGIAGEVQAAGPLARWQELWPWFGWPALVIALFGIHQFLARRTATIVCSRKGEVG
jgi:hypothetical protein